jgi:hypothetical protein
MGEGGRMKKVRNKSRKKKVAKQEGFLFVGPAAVFLLLAAAVSLSYLHLHNQCDLLGKDIRSLETELEQVRGRALAEQSRWSGMITLDGVIRAVEGHGLDMAWPQASRIVTVKDRQTANQLAMNPSGRSWSEGMMVHD